MTRTLSEQWCCCARLYFSVCRLFLLRSPVAQTPRGPPLSGINRSLCAVQRAHEGAVNLRQVAHPRQRARALRAQHARARLLINTARAPAAPEPPRCSPPATARATKSNQRCILFLRFFPNAQRSPRSLSLSARATQYSAGTRVCRSSRR